LLRRTLSPYGPERQTPRFGRFSNRPVGIKRCQTFFHHQSVNVSRGLVLRFGIGTNRASVAQRFSALLIELGEIYHSTCAGESVGNDRLTPLAQLEGNDERLSFQFRAPPRLARLGS